jgi:hypothetical protein
VELTLKVTEVGLVVTAVKVSEMVIVVAVSKATETVLPLVVDEVTVVDIETISAPLEVEAELLVMTCVAVELNIVETVP